MHPAQSKPRLALCMEYGLGQQGGTEVLVRALIEGCSEQFDIVAVSDDTPESLAASGLQAPLAAHVRWDITRRGYAQARWLAGELARHRVALAHFHSGETFLWGNRWPGMSPISHVARRGIPCVNTVHLVLPPLEGYLGAHRSRWVKLALWPLAWGAVWYSLARTEIAFAVSRHDWEILRRCAAPYADRLQVMYHSNVPEGPAPDDCLEREPVILCVGTYGPRKGQVILVETFNRLAAQFPEWRLVIAGRPGDEAYFARVEAAAARSPWRQRISVHGRLSDDEVRRLMRTSALFAMPSLQEGLGLSLQEALLLGCPAVGTRAGGIPELIDDRVNGRLVAAGDPRALADGLAELMRDPARRREMSRAARASVLHKGMTRERMIANYQRVYGQILLRRPLSNEQCFKT